MKDFEALKNIWHGQTELPKLSYEDILKNIRGTKSKFANKLLFQVIALIFSIAVMLYVLFKNDFKLGTSQLGITIFVICLLYYLFVQIRDYRNISNSENMLDKPDEYISYLKSYKHRRYILNTRVYRIYMVFIALGLALGFIEVFFTMSVWQTALAIIFTIGWFLLCYYVFMRLYIRKEEARINEMIQNLERLQAQFKEHDELV
ncbi:MAG: hypothetical protein K0S09_1574 [Sphingobacteriaceae bacterium]|jgi:uncharacterized membrane protein YbjE (DUF340 family)|nr:hypothetical protein [Sphingobacteriaceae bacterium]